MVTHKRKKVEAKVGSIYIAPQLPPQWRCRHRQRRRTESAAAQAQAQLSKKCMLKSMVKERGIIYSLSRSCLLTYAD